MPAFTLKRFLVEVLLFANVINAIDKRRIGSLNGMILLNVSMY